MKKTTVLRNLLKGDKIVVAPGAYDCVSAKVIEQAGFPVVYVTGYGLEASVLGAPDVGFLSFSEILDRANKISSAVSVPVILDAEAGFGGPIQVIRAVKEFEKAGIAGIHIEDQTMPKKCGSFATKAILPIPEAVAKIKAALDARTDPDFLIIARTDADIISVEEIIERSNRYLEAGADMIFPLLYNIVIKLKPAQKIELYNRLPNQIKGPALLILSYWDPLITVREVQAAGYKLVIYPVFTLFAATKAIMDAVNELKTTGTPSGYFEKNPGLISSPEFMEFIGLPHVLEIEKKYGVK